MGVDGWLLERDCMYQVSAFTVGCNPTSVVEADDFKGAKKIALEMTDTIIERAFGANDTSMVDDLRSVYDDFKVNVKSFKRNQCSDNKYTFGPLPDGYCVQIREI